ncbi:hypothetical protein K456DRAFT_31785 [Colletotrichum gloeosporioides 23]|nr:hypothetical protein K456DRAFT_31785 [Colletotrichum gloeosporioides 23]
MDPIAQIKAGFQRAAEKFTRSVPLRLSSQFTGDTASLPSLKDEIRTIQTELGAKGSMRNMPRLKKFIEAMTQFGLTIEVFVNAHNFVCFIWGPMKFLLVIGDAIPGHLFYKDIIERHPTLKLVLQDYYSDILEFHQEALRVLNRPIHVIRKEISDMREENSRTAKKQAQENHQSRMSLIRNRLRASDYLADQEAAAQIRKESGAGEWLFKEPQYLSWSDTNTVDHSVLYINGIPGAGKTVLVSSVISQLLELYAFKQSTTYSVAYFYFKHGNTEKNTHEGCLKAILTQLIDQDTTASQDFLDELSNQDKGKVGSRESLESLTKKALEEYRVSFLVLDGLDECDQVYAKHTVSWLLSLRNDDRYIGKTTLRMIFSGQRNGLLEKLLESYPAICLESSQHTSDIEKYCLHYGSKIQQKFDLNRELEGKIVSLVTHGAQGMFLYARVVLEYLYHQVSLGKLKKAIKPDVFPKKLENAYERIVTSIFESEHESEREVAKKIISLVVAAKRDLKWREIQSFFCIDDDEWIIDPEERLQLPPKNFAARLWICINVMDERVNQSKSYLLEKKLVDIRSEHARLVSFCTEYLLSPPFSRSSRAEEVRLHARQAYYSLQDYAVAHWYDHLQALRDALKDETAGSGHENPELMQEVRRASHSTQFFLEAYVNSIETREKNDSLTPDTILNRLPSDDVERTTLLDIEERTSWIRQNIERLNDFTYEERVILDDLYGTILPYKCPKPICSMFSEGFATTHERAQHINRHDRRFLCNFQFCTGQSFGFDSQANLKTHIKNNHEEPQAVLQFPQKERRSKPEYNKDNLLQVVRFEDMDRVVELLDGGADINAVAGGLDDYCTPLWRAVDRSNYKLCELLIERGVNLGKPSSYRPKRTNINKVNTMSSCTPLAHACAKGEIKIAGLILEAYAKSTTFADSGIRIALMKAVVKGHLEIVQLLTSFYDFSQEKDFENGPDDPLSVACERHDSLMVEFLFQNDFKFKNDVDYVAKCLPYPMRFKKKVEERWHRVESTIKVLLKTAKPTITSFAEIWRAIDYGRPSIALLMLSYPETNLATDDLSVLSRQAERKSFKDIVKLADKLLAAKVPEVESSLGSPTTSRSGSPLEYLDS